MSLVVVVMVVALSGLATSHSDRHALGVEREHSTEYGRIVGTAQRFEVYAESRTGENGLSKRVGLTYRSQRETDTVKFVDGCAYGRVAFSYGTPARAVEPNSFSQEWYGMPGHDYWGDKPAQGPPIIDFPCNACVLLPESLTAAGRYELITSTARTTVVLTDQQQYLDLAQIAPVTVNQYGSLRVCWAPVPGAVGYVVDAGNMPGVHAQWRNSNKNWQAMGTLVALQSGVLLKDTRCVIPAGLFHGPMVVKVTAISPEVRVNGPIPAIGWAQSES